MQVKHFILGVALFLSLMVGAMAGWGVPGTPINTVPRAYADGCDNSLPPPGVECPDTPTPTPTKTP